MTFGVLRKQENFNALFLEIMTPYLYFYANIRNIYRKAFKKLENKKRKVFGKHLLAASFSEGTRETGYVSGLCGY